MGILSSIVWDVDPILIHFGDGGIRWYGLLWAIGLYICWVVNERMYKHENCPAEWADYMFFYMAAGVIIGSDDLCICTEFIEYISYKLVGKLKSYFSYMSVIDSENLTGL